MVNFKRVIYNRMNRSNESWLVLSSILKNIILYYIIFILLLFILYIYIIYIYIYIYLYIFILLLFILYYIILYDIKILKNCYDCQIKFIIKIDNGST